MAIIDMQTMRYINLLDKASNVKTKRCFFYGGVIFFAVPSELVSRAIGPQASNIRKIEEKLGRRIRIIKEPNGIKDMDEFLKEVVLPTRFKSIEIIDNEVLMIAGSNQNKANLFGRNKKRYEELKKIVEDIFNLNLRIL